MPGPRMPGHGRGAGFGVTTPANLQQWAVQEPPLGSPHPTPLWGSEGNAFQGVSARPGLGPTSTFLCPDFIR